METHHVGRVVVVVVEACGGRVDHSVGRAVAIHRIIEMFSRRGRRAEREAPAHDALAGHVLGTGDSSDKHCGKQK